MHIVIIILIKANNFMLFDDKLQLIDLKIKEIFYFSKNISINWLKVSFTSLS